MAAIMEPYAGVVEELHQMDIPSSISQYVYVIGDIREHFEILDMSKKEAGCFRIMSQLGSFRLFGTYRIADGLFPAHHKFVGYNSLREALQHRPLNYLTNAFTPGFGVHLMQVHLFGQLQADEKQTAGSIIHMAQVVPCSRVVRNFLGEPMAIFNGESPIYAVPNPAEYESQADTHLNVHRRVWYYYLPQVGLIEFCFGKLVITEFGFNVKKRKPSFSFPCCMGVNGRFVELPIKVSQRYKPTLFEFLHDVQKVHRLSLPSDMPSRIQQIKLYMNNEIGI